MRLSHVSVTSKAEEAAEFQSVRSRLFGIAYRTLGRVEEAEDVVQDVWVRWQGADRARVRDQRAAERSEELERAVLLLQRLSPTERAVFVLREAFDYPFREIAEALGTSEANARQIGRRARANLAGARRAPVRPAAHGRLLSAFLDAARVGAVGDLERLLAEDASPEGRSVEPAGSMRHRWSKTSPIGRIA